MRSLFIDSTRVYDGSNPRIWLATGAYTITNGSATTNGRVGEGLYAATPFFRPVTNGINISSATSLGCNAMGGNKNIVWTFIGSNFGRNQIFSYDAATRAFLTAYDNSTVPLIPVNITVRAIYTDMYERTWFGLAENALLVYDEHQQWHYINFPGVFTGQVNANAITGSKYSDVYIGTSTGLVFSTMALAKQPVLTIPFFTSYILLPTGCPPTT